MGRVSLARGHGHVSPHHSISCPQEEPWSPPESGGPGSLNATGTLGASGLEATTFPYLRGLSWFLPPSTKGITPLLLHLGTHRRGPWPPHHTCGQQAGRHRRRENSISRDAPCDDKEQIRMPGPRSVQPQAGRVRSAHQRTLGLRCSVCKMRR